MIKPNNINYTPYQIYINIIVYNYVNIKFYVRLCYSCSYIIYTDVAIFTACGVYFEKKVVSVVYYYYGYYKKKIFIKCW